MHRFDSKYQFRTVDKMKFSANIKLINMNKLFRSELEGEAMFIT